MTFCAVVDRGSFSAAADDLEISQPAVSFQIRALESLLGQRLLDRRGRRVALTEAGRVLEGYARRMLALQSELERAMADVGEHIAGKLLLGSSTGPGEVLLPRLLWAFRAEHRDVTVSLVVHDTAGICERVLEGELELGVVGAARPVRGLVFEPFIRDELVVIVPPDHRLARRRRLELAELAGEPLIMQQRGSGVRSVLEAAIRERGMRLADLDVTMELGLQQSAKAAVLDGRHHGHLPARGRAGGRGRAPGGDRPRRAGADPGLLGRARRRPHAVAALLGVPRVRPRPAGPRLGA